jgi:hypothetical protein
MPQVTKCSGTLLFPAPPTSCHYPPPGSGVLLGANLLCQDCLHAMGRSARAASGRACASLRDVCRSTQIPYPIRT